MSGVVRRGFFFAVVVCAGPAGVGRLARRGRIVEPDQRDATCPVLLAKIFLFPSDANHLRICRRLVPLEGRLAIVTDAGRDAVDVGDVTRRMTSRADGEAVWS